MTFNAELARQALADVDADPERWNQMSYRGAQTCIQQREPKRPGR